ncbi:NADH:ubiquinone oxidoreductase [Geotalea sp. SG265]|uniref:NADH-quinone oxidoreductase subunit B family protein n=1 Tax=Geotalea sp. SG265 TaxID=2922867 RepID=UPI001FAFC3AF|nr:NADH:ubiquinone oxidoreductase [Geotalea sp. SG265]
MNRPVIAFAGLTACSGCQLTLLNCEEELPQLAEMFDFAYFPMGRSENDDCCSLEVSFVEGAVSTPGDLEILLNLRSRSRLLVGIGTCALWGGIAAMKNHQPRLELTEAVYGNFANAVKTFPPGPLSRFVTVDFAVPGCPPETNQVMQVLASLLHGTLPVFPGYPVCTECRNRENLCLLIEKNELCLGPLIQSGCNARCPAVSVACEGCRGPATEANVAAEIDLLVEKGFSREEINSRLRRFYPEWDNGQRY